MSEGTETIKVDFELDLKGMLCPMPMVTVSQNINKVPVGGVLKAVATDPGSLADIPAWAMSTGQEILEIKKESPVMIFYIKRIK
jgi:tRNA 2-thiouridine synthesizing protein A